MMTDGRDGENDSASARIELAPLQPAELAELATIGAGYSSDSRYAIAYHEAEGAVSFELSLERLAEPYRKQWPYDEATLQHYAQLLPEGYSFGAYAGPLLVGLAVAEARLWNGSLWVWEFHVRETYRRRGIGRRLMDRLAEQARAAGLRVIVCETQTTNTAAIAVYQRLGFRLEGIDLSYYSNDDYPDGEVAVFMKKRLEVGDRPT